MRLLSTKTTLAIKDIGWMKGKAKRNLQMSSKVSFTCYLLLVFLLRKADN